MGRILIIRGGAIGDFVLTLPAIHLLRTNFPETEIEILGYKNIVALAESRFYATRSRSIEYAPLAKFFIPRGELPDDLVEYFSGFDQVISYLFDPDGFFHGNLKEAGVENLICGSPKISDTQHAAYQLAAPLQNLALFLDDPAAKLFPTDDDRTAATSLHGITKRKMIALHPGSGSETKNWPTNRWIALARWLAEKFPNLEFLLISGEADSIPAESLRRALPSDRTREAANLPLPDLAASFEHCALFIGHDSGISHIAAAVDTPCILLFGATDPDIWAPQNHRVQIIHSPNDSMAGITPVTVREAITSQLQNLITS